MKSFFAKILLGLVLVFGAAGVHAQNVAVTGADAATNAASPFATLSAAFVSINASTQAGNIISITIIGNTAEPAAGAALNQSSGPWTSLSIQPSGGVARIVSGAVTAGSPLIDFNGADNVTIDGLNSGGNSLTISNTTVSATSNTSTIRFQTDATSNIINRCSILGSSTMAVGTNGGNIIFTSGAITTGNDNNTISNCDIGPAGSNLPSKGIYFSGSSNTDPGTGNSGNVITGNNIFDYFSATTTSAGIYVTSGTPVATFSNNKFYQTATRTQTTGTQHSAIWITNSSGNGYLISGNTIGFASNAGSGSYTLVGVLSTTFVPIFLNVGTTTATSIQGNTISNIAMSGVLNGQTIGGYFRCFYVSSGLVNIGNISGNNVGSQLTTGNMTFTSSSTNAGDVLIYANNGSSTAVFNNNVIGGISVSNSSTGLTSFYGPYCNTSTSSTATYLNNTIGGNIANSISVSASNTSSVIYGIRNNSSFAPAMTATGNIIRNLTINSANVGGSQGASVIGILHVNGTSTPNTISQNQIYALSNSNASAATSVMGIVYIGNTGSNIIARNFIHSLSNSTANSSATVYGITTSGGTTSYQNNMIRLGIDDAGASQSVGYIINGIGDLGGINNYYFNSVYIGGTGVAGSANTYAFQSTITSNTRIFRNNIFYNARSNGAGTGKHYAVRVGGTAPNPTGMTINNNIYLANGTGGVFGFFNSLDVASLSAWKTAVGQDAGSYNSDPQYLTPAGTSATVDLHIDPTNPTQVEGNGFNIPAITDDFDGQLRASFTPEDIGADAGNFTAAGDINPPVITYTPLTFTCSTGDRSLNGVIITDVSGVPTTGALQPRIYYKKGVGGTWFSSQGTLATGSATNGTWNFTIVAADMGGVAGGDVIYYYVIAQDIAGTPNITSNPAAGLVATDVNTVTTPPTAPNSYSISNTLSGSYNVGSAQTYTTLTQAIAAYNSSCLGGAVTFLLTDAAYTEAGAMTINANADASAVKTLTIKPSIANTTLAVTGGSSGAIITLNGADYITIDGSLSGGTDRNLTITNTNSGGSSAVIWLQSNGSDGATNNTIKNLTITGNSNTTTLFGIGSGSSTISTSSLGTGNNSNTVRNNNITKTQYGIYSAGASTAAKNTGNTVTQNLMNGTATDAQGVAGILLVNENNVAVTDNKIANISGSGTKYGISLGATSFNSYSPGTSDAVTNASVRRNSISAITCTSSSSAFGIVVCPSTSGTNEFINNAISAINGSATPSDFTAGLYVGGGAGSATNVYYNSISMSGSATRTTNSFALAIGGSNPVVDVRDNIFYNNSTTSGAGSSYAFGTAYSSSFSNLTFNYNDLFTAGANAQFAGVGSISAPTNQANLAALNTTIGGGANSISSDPLFNSPTNLSPQIGSPVIGVATPIAGVTIDILNVIRSGTNPTMGAYESGGDFIPPVITYTTLTTSCSTGDRALNAVTITDASGVPTAGALQPRVYYRKNAGTWFSSQGILATGTGISGTWNFTIVAADMGGLTGGDVIQYYVIAQDIASPTNISSNPAAGLVASDVNTVTTPPTTPNSTTVGTTLNGTYTVGSGGNYTTLTAAITAYNNACLTGAVIFNLTDAAYNTGETFPVSINLNNNASAVNTLTIRPTLTSVISGSNATSLITFNGARFVIIDGRIGGTGTTHSLTIANASTSGPAVVLINDANNNAVKFTDLKADNTSTTSGVVLFSTTTGANGNDDNTIDNCNIGPNAANPTNGIYSAGTTTTTVTYNSTNIISNNNIFDFYNSTSTSNAGVGVNVSSGNTDWTISGNSLYQTAARTTFGTGATFNGILISSTNNNNVAILNNFIGGSAANCGGSALTLNAATTLVLRAIQATVGTVTPSSIQGNTIQNISLTTTSASTAQSLISAVTGSFNIGNVTANTLGSQSADASVSPSVDISISGSGAIFSALIAGTGTPGALNIANNTIGGIRLVNTGAPATGTSLRGIGIQSAPTALTLNNNTVGSSITANSIVSSTTSSILGIFLSTTITGSVVTNNTVSNVRHQGTTSTSQLIGMLMQGSSGGSFTTTGNTVSNLTSSAPNIGTSTSASVIGILHTAASTAGQTISQNTVYGLSNTDAAAAVAVTGIHYAGPTTGSNVVARNLVHSLSVASTSATAEIRGISFTSGLANVQNNMIRLGTTLANGNTIYGLYEVGSTTASGIYFNSVYVGGSGVGTQTGNSYAFRSNQTFNTRTFQNNIFVNARSNASTGGKHYAVWVAGTAPNPAGLTLNYNDYLATGTGGVFGFFNSADVASLAAWQAAVGQDANSISGDPQFINATGATPDLHIHPTNPTPVESAGLAIGAVTDDFDGQTRAGLTPTDIGADAGDFVVGDISAPIITYTTLTGTCTAGDRALNGVTITDGSGVPTSGALQPRIYYRKNAGSWFSSQGTLASGTATNGTWNFTIVAADMGGLVTTDVVSYYVIAQDIAVTPNISSNPAAGLVATDVNTVTTPPASPNSYTIQGSLSGIYTVGATGFDYPTLSAAIAAYNASCLGGPVVFELKDPTYAEAGGMTINANADASVTNTLTIRPAAGVTAAVSATSASGAVLKILGKYVTIDGSNNGSSSRNLSITNNSATSPSVVWIGSTGLTPITNVTIKNCVLTNGINTSSAVYVLDGASTATAGYFNNISILNNQIQKAFVGIYSNAIVATGNGSGLTINSNDLSASGANALRNGGIVVQGVDGATVQNNNIGNFETATAERDYGVYLGLGTTNSRVDKNTIHDLKYTGTSGYAGQGVIIATGLAAANDTISNNMIYGMTGDADSYTSFGAQYSPVGIYASGTGQGGINIYFNTIYLSGSTLNYSSASYSIGIALDNTSSANIKNNIVYNQLGRLGTTGVGGVGIAAQTSTAQFTSLDYNDYVTSVPTGSNFIGKIGGTNYATLAAWQAASGTEVNSKNIVPVFVSANDLHLNPASNCALHRKGTPIAGLTIDFDNDTRNATRPDMGADEYLISTSGTITWTGTVSTDWFDVRNWDLCEIPGIASNVVINGGAPNYPIVTADVTINSLFANPGATITIATGVNFILLGP